MFGLDKRSASKGSAEKKKKESQFNTQNQALITKGSFHMTYFSPGEYAVP